MTIRLNACTTFTALVVVTTISPVEVSSPPAIGTAVPSGTLPMATVRPAGASRGRVAPDGA